MDGTFSLSNGVRMPAIGFGTWNITPDNNAEKAVREALRIGYRHIDTAKLYGNEHGVGKAVRGSDINREDVFVTTKLWNSDHEYEAAMRAFDESLEKLGIGYIDLYLIHWPANGGHDDAWRALQDIFTSGKAKSIGVSNFSVRQLTDILDAGEMKPMVNQIEFHPYIYEEQKQLLDFCKQQQILVQAYSPLSRHAQSPDPEIVDIATRVGKSPSQVILRWCLQHGTSPLPRSQTPAHMQENFEVFDFELSNADMERINQLSD